MEKPSRMGVVAAFDLEHVSDGASLLFILHLIGNHDVSLS